MLLLVFHYCICVFILCRCRSFNPSFGPLSPFLLHYVATSIHICVVCRHFCCPMSLFQGQHVLLVEISPTGPQESDQNKCNQRKPTEGWSYTKLYCCMGLMGLKSENKKRSVKIRRYH